MSAAAEAKSEPLGIDDVQALLRRRAVATGLCAESASDDDSARAIEALLDREVSVPVPSDDECRRFYDAHPELFVAGELAELRHILFAVTARTPVDALRRKAEETLMDLRRDPTLFDARARELSNCPSGAQGGGLGQLARGDGVPEFERSVFGVSTLGVLPTLVNSRFGFHIVCVDRRAPGRRAPFDAVRADVAARMTKQSWRRALAQYVDVLAGEAEGSVASALVQ